MWIVGNENGEPVIAERQIRIMDKPLGHRDVDDGMWCGNKKHKLYLTSDCTCTYIASLFVLFLNDV